MKITDLLFPEDLEALPLPFEKLKAGETTFSRRRVRTQTGVERIMELSSRMLPDETVMAILRDVTERNEAEKALRNSEIRFRTLTGNAPVGIFETDTEGATTYVNQKMMEYTGFSFDELLQTNWLECIHPDDRAALINGWSHNLEEKEESSQQYRIIAKDGSIRWVQGKAIPVYDKNGQFNGYLGTVTDITKEKKAVLALADSEEKYRTLVEQASDAIYIVDDSGMIVTVNPSACRLSGYTEQEMLKMNILDFVFAQDIQINPFHFDELKQGKTVIVERRFKIKDSKVVDVECLANMLSDGRILVFARDITERIKIRNEILKEKNFSDSIINSLPGVFYLYDDKGRFIRWNKNFEHVSGYSAEQVSNMHPLDFFDEPEKELLRQKVEEVFLKGMADVEAPFFTHDKRKIPYYFNGWRVIFENKTCLIGVGIDITEKRKAEELLLQSYDDIRRLASHLTHIREDERKRIGREIHDELGQQLTAIKMDMAWIDKRIADENELIRKKIKNVITLLDGGNKSVRRILTELSPGINDNHGLLEALARLNRQFEDTTGIPVEFISTENTVELSQDIANCIFRVYQESLTNIMRYAGAGKVAGSITIEGGIITVTISDDGKGFDTGSIPAKTSFGILGMKERVLSLNGKFDLKSAKGKGTVVTIMVPYRQ
jgi:PAS domain S-box-containing protein